VDMIDLESFTNFLDIDFCVFMEDGFTKTSLFQEVIWSKDRLKIKELDMKP